MNNVQKLISELKVRKKSHKRHWEKTDSLPEARYFDGKNDECDFLIRKLKWLLNTEKEKQQ